MTISGMTIIRNGIRGSYPFPEAITTVLPYVDEYVVMNDSNDGTTEVLEKMRKKYGKIVIYNEPWPLREWGPISIAVITNKGLEKCKGSWIIHSQADEVYTPAALDLAVERIQRDEPYYAYLVNRIQTGPNFQSFNGDGISTCRIGRAGKFHSVQDGLCMDVEDQNYDGLSKVGEYHMFDVTRTFVGNFPGRSYTHAEVWWQNPNRNAGGWYDKTPEQWKEQVEGWRKEGFPEEYLRTTSPYWDILPESLRYWVGRPYYFPRPELVEMEWEK